MEEESLINPIYQLVKENTDKTKEEIYNIPPIIYAIKLKTS